MIDSHAHVAFAQFDDDRDEVIKRARNAGVVGWIEVGTDLKQSQKAIDIVRQYGLRQTPRVSATVGVHPSEVKDLTSRDWKKLEELIKQEEVAAVGEVGLDFYRGGKKEEQLPALRKFISLAVKNNLPVVWHVRSGEEADAHDELLALLSSYQGDKRPSGVIHSYSGTLVQAKEYLELGMYLSFTGVVTFKNAGGSAKVAEEVPLEKILLETDCPYLTPEPHRGKRNEPAYVKFVAEKIAELKEISVEEVARVTDDNVKRLFGV